MNDRGVLVGEPNAKFVRRRGNHECPWRVDKWMKAGRTSLHTGLLISFLLAGWFPGVAQNSQSPEKIEVDVLKEKLDKGEQILVIDVRTEEEVKSGSIPGAIHIPLGKLKNRMAAIPKDRQLVFT